jgi:DNA-binding MarR family transcriptional regulator
MGIKSSPADRHPKDLAAELGKRNPFDNLAQEAAINVVRTSAMLTSQGDHLLKEFGISGPQYNALRILRGEGQPMQVYQIAERMVTPQTDITRLIDRLEKAGLVTRERCGDDRRVVWVTLTAAAKSTLKKIDRPLLELHDRQFQHLSQRDLKTLNELLFRVRHPS